jgi:hypothetical protein
MPETDAEAGYYTLPEIAAKMRMSERWVRGELDPKRGKNIEHSRPGGRIRMSDEQIEKFRAAYDVQGAPQSITTGRRKRSA